MSRRDARSLPAIAQEENRRTAIRLRQDGQTFAAIGAVLGVHWATVLGWWHRFEQGGLAALAARRRGRRPGTHRRLTPAQERTLQRLITDKTPDQLRMPFALWTRAAIGELTRRRYGLRLPVRTIARWLKHEYPAIKARAKREGAEIHWGDETSLSTSDPRGRGFAPRGRTPVLRVVAQRRSVSFLSTITNRGKVRFMVLPGPLAARLLIGFLRRLVRDAKRKVFLILDQLNVHKAAKMRAWVRAHRDEIAVFYLPPYAPELNPDEYLNGDLKLAVAARTPARTKPELTQVAKSHLRSLQRRPARVRRFFEHPRVTYAA